MAKSVNKFSCGAVGKINARGDLNELTNVNVNMDSSLSFNDWMLSNLWLFTCSELCVLRVVNGVLSDFGYTNLVYNEDYLYAPGEIPVLLVAHADTVHLAAPAENNIYYDSRRGVLWSPVGLGADDRAGIAGILELLRRGHRPHVLITTGEESGVVGAAAFVEDFKGAAVNVRYVIELDRKGKDDAVFYECKNQDFESYVESFGFVKATGVFSDINVICPARDIAGVNLSCGYYNQHTAAEHLVLGELEATVERVSKMLSAVPDSVFSYYTTQNFVIDADDYFIEPLYVRVDIEELMSLYGGDAAVWSEIIYDNYHDLVDEATDAVYNRLSELALNYERYFKFS